MRIQKLLSMVGLKIFMKMTCSSVHPLCQLHQMKMMKLAVTMQTVMPPMFTSTAPKHHIAIDHSTSTENLVVTPSPETEHLDNHHISHYKLVFDNINKTVTPRFQSLESPRVTLNYVNMFAFKDRAVPSSHLSRVSRYFPTGLSKAEVAKAILPTCKDDESLRYNFSLFISRVLVQHFSFFNLAFNDVVDWHIEHQYYKEMSMKSEVVPLGVLPKDENKHEDKF